MEEARTELETTLSCGRSCHRVNGYRFRPPGKDIFPSFFLPQLHSYTTPHELVFSVGANACKYREKEAKKYAEQGMMSKSRELDS